jgi:hypothetical protein
MYDNAEVLVNARDAADTTGEADYQRQRASWKRRDYEFFLSPRTILWILAGYTQSRAWRSMRSINAGGPLQ